MRTWKKPILLFTVILLLGGCASDSSQQANPTASLPVIAPSPAVPILLKGSGDKATRAFRLEKGFVIVDAKHSGDGNFALHLTDASGEKELLVNKIGYYKGKTLALVDGGEYLMNVKADGQWTLNMTQVEPVGPNAPVMLKGVGDSVVTANLTAKKNQRMTFTNSGKGNFVVMISGDYLLVNEIGAYTGSTTINTKDSGPYLFSVRSEGAWSINIE